MNKDKLHILISHNINKEEKKQMNFSIRDNLDINNGNKFRMNSFDDLYNISIIIYYSLYNNLFFLKSIEVYFNQTGKKPLVWHNNILFNDSLSNIL